MKSIKQRIIDKELSFGNACIKHYNELTREDFDYIIDKTPLNVLYHLGNHPLINENDIDYLIKIAGTYSVVRNCHERLTEKHISWIAENKPDLLKDIFK